MDKAQLAMIFANLIKNQAPAIANVLQTTDVNAPEVNPLATLLTLGSRQYDLPLIEEDVADAASGLPTNGAYALEGYADKALSESLSPSKDILDLNENDLKNFSISDLESMGADAAATAKRMLLRDTTSPLEGRALLQPDMSLNERINSKALDNALGLGVHQTSNPENEIFALNNPQASIDANYKVGRILGIVPQGYDAEQDIKKKMFKMLTSGKKYNPFDE